MSSGPGRRLPRCPGRHRATPHMPRHATTQPVHLPGGLCLLPQAPGWRRGHGLQRLWCSSMGHRSRSHHDQDACMAVESIPHDHQGNPNDVLHVRMHACHLLLHWHSWPWGSPHCCMALLLGTSVQSHFLLLGCNQLQSRGHGGVRGGPLLRSAHRAVARRCRCRHRQRHSRHLQWRLRLRRRRDLCLAGLALHSRVVCPSFFRGLPPLDLTRYARHRQLHGGHLGFKGPAQLVVLGVLSVTRPPGQVQSPITEGSLCGFCSLPELLDALVQTADGGLRQRPTCL
mmetsp:Transcript_75438/g.208164  ORF Transcript_75438/g.208164 Transcript_75438/m.208164 type:complete len:285 (+) Transcript_75438:18-872(+)